MRTVGVRAHVPLNASDALARLRDGSWRTRLPGDVVSVRDAGDAEEWTVRFGRGAVRWRQREAGAEPSAVAFEQVDGDFAKLSVTWTCEPAPSTACQVNFEARFDLGVPMHDRVFEPLLARALARAARAVLTAAYSQAEIEESPATVPDPEREVLQAIATHHSPASP